MKVSVYSFWLPKFGSKQQEYEDDYDFSYNRNVRGKRETKPYFIPFTRKMTRPRFAIADGATESSFSGLWSHLLVENYVDKAPQKQETLRKLVEKCGYEWKKQIETLSLPWYAQNKVEKGAFSTLLGITIHEPQFEVSFGGIWSALAVGDTCIFQVRENEMIDHFPIKRAIQFGYHPILLSSIPEKNHCIWNTDTNILYHSGIWLPNDTFFIASDALAQWFLTEVEKGYMPWQILQELTECTLALKNAFPQWIKQQRQINTMRNDDVTLLIVTIHEQY